MSGLDGYSDAESVIEDTESENQSSHSSGLLAAVNRSFFSSLTGAVSNLLHLSSSESDKPMDTNGNKSAPLLRPGQQALRSKGAQGAPQSEQQSYKVFKTKNEPSREAESNKINILNVIKPPSGIGRGLPILTHHGVREPYTPYRPPSNAPPGPPQFAALSRPPTLSHHSSPPGLSVRSPVLSDPGDSPIKRCDVCHMPSGVSNQCRNCNRAQHPPPIFCRKFEMGNSSVSDPKMPSLKVERPEPDQRESKRPRSSDSDVEEVLPPNLRKETPIDAKTIPETPPKELKEEPFSLLPNLLYLGNIPCNFRDVKVEGDCLHLMSIGPKPDAGSRQIKFNIKVPFSEITAVWYYSEMVKNGPKNGHYIFVKPDSLSTSKIMGTLKDALTDDRWLFDSDNHHDGVKFLYIKCNQDLKIGRLLSLLRSTLTVVSAVDEKWSQQRQTQITTNAYERSLIDKRAKTIPKRGRTPGKNIPSRSHYVPSTSRSHSSFTFDDSITSASPLRSRTARMGSRSTKPTTVEIVELDDDDEEEEDSSVKKSTNCVALVEPKFEPDQMLFVYPPYEPAVQVQIYGRDLDCLAPQEYLNDNIIDFYLQYILKNSVPKGIRDRTHIFTTFFFTKLAGAKRETVSLKDKPLAVYERVKKWLKNVDIFSKDYLVIPVNRSHHWFLIIVCNMNNVQEVDGSEIQAIDTLPRAKMPCILVMDSLGIVRTGGANKLTNSIRYALEEEWKSKKKGDKKFDHANIPDRNLKPPLQDNSFDCGLFLIKYVECFLRDPDKVLNAPKNTLGREFLDIKEAKSLRKGIRNTIYELYKRNQIVVESTEHEEEAGHDDDDSKDDNSEIEKMENNGHPYKPGPASMKKKMRASAINKSGSSDCDMEVIEEHVNQPQIESTVHLNDSIQESTINSKDATLETSTTDLNDSLMTDDEDPIASPGKKRRSSSVISIKNTSALKNDTTEQKEEAENQSQEKKDENEDVSNKNGVIDISTEDEEPEKADDSQLDELAEMIG